MNSVNKLFAPTLLSLLLAGCSLTPIYEQPTAPVAASIGEASTAETAETLELLQWHQVFMDPQLQGLIRQGIDQNRDLREAVLNVQAARAQYRIQHADTLPQVGIYGEAGRQRTPGSLTPTGQSDTSGLYALGGMATYEADFFGRIRSLSDQALQLYLASAEGHRSAQIALVSEIANAYLTWVVDNQLLALAQQTQQSREKTLHLVESQYKLGVATQLDLSQAKGAVYETASRAAEFSRRVEQAKHALQLLVGSADTLSLTAPVAIDTVVQLAGIPATLPSSVLLQRPDVLAAEYEIRAANGNIGAARAAFFPRISLTAAGGVASADLSNLFDGGAGAWSFLPRLDLPIFDFGQRQANLDLAEVQRDIRITRYEKAIQTSFKEVADALMARKKYREQLQAQEALVQEAQISLNLSERRYETGIDSFLHVLDAQRTLFDAQQYLLTSRLQQQLNLVQLYRSVGGGWG